MNPDDYRIPADLAETIAGEAIDLIEPLLFGAGDEARSLLAALLIHHTVEVSAETVAAFVTETPPAYSEAIRLKVARRKAVIQGALSAALAAVR